MADDIGVLELDEELAVEAGETEREAEAVVLDENAPEEAEITFDGEAAPASGDSDLVKHLRAQIRERDKRLAQAATVKAPVTVGPKPDLWEDCEGDVEKYDAAYDAWKEAKAQSEKVEVEQSSAQREVQETWQAERAAYKDGLARLPYADKAEAQETVEAALTVVQQAVIVKASDNPAKVVYALGKTPGKLAELAAITDPLKLAVAVAKLEGKIQVMPKRTPVSPERVASGNAAVQNGGVDKILERLEAEADKTGNRDKVLEYKRKLRA